MKVYVLRLGHRFSRDKRLTTHVALTSRAFGADELLLDCKDLRISNSVERIVKNWGGRFKVSFLKNWQSYVRSFKGDVIHLSMYGLNVNNVIDRIRSSNKDKLIIIGGKKVPSEVYKMADYNIAVGHQPHSEVAALSVFLDRIFSGDELDAEHAGGKRIVPQEHGKKVVN